MPTCSISNERFKWHLNGCSTLEISAKAEAFIAKHTTEMGIEIADQAPALEEVARAAEALPVEVASASTGLDRMSVRMSELSDPTTAPPTARTEQYERTPPPPKERHYRKAWVGSTSIYEPFGRSSNWTIAS